MSIAAPFVTGCPQLLEDDFSSDGIVSVDTNVQGSDTPARDELDESPSEPGRTPPLVAGGGSTATERSGGGGVPSIAASGAGPVPVVPAGGSPEVPFVWMDAGVGGGSELGGAGGAGAGGASPQAGAGSAGGTGGQTCVPAGEACDGLDNDCDEEVDEGSETCPPDCVGYAWGERGYMICDDPRPHAEAQVACQSAGMQLAAIESDEENQALVDAVQLHVSPSSVEGEPSVWIGAEDLDEDGEWTWANGDPIWRGAANGAPVGGAYSNWGPDRPNNGNSSGEHCVVFQVEEDEGLLPGEWNDNTCSAERAFVCEPE